MRISIILLLLLFASVAPSRSEQPQSNPIPNKGVFSFGREPQGQPLTPDRFVESALAQHRAMQSKQSHQLLLSLGGLVLLFGALAIGAWIKRRGGVGAIARNVAVGTIAEGIRAKRRVGGAIAGLAEEARARADQAGTPTSAGRTPGQSPSFDESRLSAYIREKRPPSES